MIVLDTSAAVELLLSLPLSKKVHRTLDDAEWNIASPQILTLEVLQVMRRRVAAGITPIGVAEEGRALLHDLGVNYFDHQALADRVWSLRDNLTAYDASYIALAEALDVALVTTDSRMVNAPGNSARITLIQ